ncbi:YtpR family tRNA-binding protein [Weissella tructae]|jgi:tRNA-binding protein|uniref:PheT_1 protein n=2 Tax=Weissella TaxID=46255 RepID=A0A075TV70_9LACO|nr:MULTISPECIES: DUF4479 and tRNA-binding domain-containing protein [Weissella]AIG65434.1 PheT_1 protein [Weissella tructae]AIM62748.1 PheT_1 protein [Weissella ceti]AIM64083.1 PheT_1 protein [Weissella ceti]ELA07106.1 tRNA-binding domain protein [Weissella ceti NC36]QVV91810.1 DUF4479 domain-containing protein [Weissella tructae]
MLIATYNQAGMGNVLMLLTAQANGSVTAEQHGDVVRLIDAQNQVVGFNILNATEHLQDLAGAGQVHLSASQVETLNTLIQANDFSDELVADTDPKFVVGYVDSVTTHPDSDHLQITDTLVGNDEHVQIVSGSPNMKAGITVVVAKVGAMMPSGLIIWPGELRGEASNGMIVSGRELGLPNAPQQPGAMILPDNFAPIGTPFDRESDEAQAIFD